MWERTVHGTVQNGMPELFRSVNVVLIACNHIADFSVCFVSWLIVRLYNISWDDSSAI